MERTPPPAYPVTLTQGMSRQATGLDHSDQWAPQPPPLPNCNDRQVQALFDTVVAFNVPVAPGLPVRVDILESVLHALLTIFISREAELATPPASLITRRLQQQRANTEMNDKLDR